MAGNHQNAAGDEGVERKIAFLAAILEHSDDAIISKNLDGIITSWNKGAEYIFGYQAEEVIGRPVSILIPPERMDEERMILERIRQGERVDHYQTVRRCKDGSYVDVSLTVSPIKNGKGKLIGAAKIARDIGRQNRATSLTAGRLAAMVENSDDAIYSHDLNAVVTSWNRGAERIFGYTAQEAIGKPLASLIIPAARQSEDREVIVRLQQGERVEQFETTRVTKDGREIDVSLTVSPVREASSGRVLEISKVARDITNRKRAEMALRQSEALKAGILNAGLDCIVTMNHECEILEFNPAAEKTFGYERKDVIGKSMPDFLIPPRLREAHWRGIKRYLATGESRVLGHRIEMPAIRSDGSEFLCELAISRVPLEGPPLFTAFIRDITARKRNEEAVALSAAQFQLAVESAPNGLVMVDQHGNITMINAQMERLFGYERGEMIGRPVEMLLPERYRAAFPGERQDFFRSPLTRVMGHGRDLVARRKDGTEFPVEVGLNPAETPDGPVVLAAVIDITQRKRMEQELAKAHVDLEDHARNLETKVAERTANLHQTIAELETFSFTISHDLRSPLRAMQGFAQALSEEYADKLDAQGQEYLKRISNAAMRLDTLIREVLTFSRIGRTPLTIETIDLETLVAEVIETYPSIKLPHARITIESPLHSVLGSRAALVQCISNLLVNAVKFVPAEATAMVRVWTEKHDSKTRFLVGDNGIGIPEDLLSKIFEPFQRGHPHAGYEGTGMGLAIVRKATQRMGGDVGVQSQVGKGSTFWIELPSAE